MKKGRIILINMLFISGIICISYPAISNWFARQEQNRVICNYDEVVHKIEKEKKEKEWTKARNYNDQLIGKNITDPFIADSGSILPDNYEDILNVDGIMGALEIPSIDVTMPIFHGSSNFALKHGAAHLQQSALPIGGKGYHSVLSSHRGLPEARLFTDLDKVKLKDVFYIEILGETHAYKVDMIRIVEPENTRYFAPEKGKDFITLLTCTPYGINSHRLLVRGHRIPYTVKEKSVDDNKWIIYLFMMGCVLAFMLYYRYRKKSK